MDLGDKPGNTSLMVRIPSHNTVELGASFKTVATTDLKIPVNLNVLSVRIKSVLKQIIIILVHSPFIV